MSTHRSVVVKNNWNSYLDSFIRLRGLHMDHFTTETSFETACIQTFLSAVVVKNELLWIPVTGKK